MSDITIRVHNLGKMYRIDVAEKRPQSAWEAARRLLGVPFEYLRRMGRPPTAEETLWALKDVSFEVKQGEVVGIIGRNGAGKTTLLKILSRITEPTEGRAIINGRVGSLLEVGTGFHPELTGRENIYMNGAILGMKKTEVDRKFDEIVDFSGVDKFIDTPVKRYSSGMYVRLAFAVAAHLETEILLVDEVLAVGDAEFRRKCLNKMGNVAQEGRTVLFVSHNMAAITNLCDSAILLENGHISLNGSAEQVVSHYLASSIAGDGVAHFSDENPVASIRMVGVVDSQGNYRQMLPVHQDFRFRTQCEIKEHLDMAQIAFAVVSSEGTRVFITSTCDKEPMRNVSLLPGLYLAEVCVPGNFLNTGTYSLNVRVLGRTRDQAKRKTHAKIFSALNLTIAETGSVAYMAGDRRRGVVTPILDWRVVEVKEDLPIST